MRFRNKVLFCLVMFSQFLLINFSYAYFKDISSHWAEDIILKWSDLGYIHGDNDKNFKPDNNVTRAEMIEIFNNIAYPNIEVPENFEISINDVSINSWCYASIKKAKYIGYIDFDNNNNFRPNDYITREQVISLAGIIYGIKTSDDENYAYLNSYSDFSNINPVARPYLNEFVKLGVLKGYENNKICPDKNITRAEVVCLLDNFLDKDVSLNSYVESDDKKAPIINVEYNTDNVLTMLKLYIDVKVDYGTKLEQLKYEKGIKQQSYFETEGIDILNKKTVDILSNGVYTIFAKDNYKNSSTKFISINNIDNEILQFFIKYSTEPATKVNVSLVENKDTKISKLLYLKGAKKLEDFETEGIDITSSKSFDVIENGYYTIYLKDSKENVEIKVINISNIIDLKEPYIFCYDESGNIKTFNNIIDVDTDKIYATDDESGISKVELRYLNKTLKTYEISENKVCIPLEELEKEKVYELYLEDNFKNISKINIELKNDYECEDN